ncbi:hypothetical protein HAX54_030592, partial [Datura stramonium]|nr:hypothetical protein [Datura stramonium]
KRIKSFRPGAWVTGEMISCHTCDGGVDGCQSDNGPSSSLPRSDGGSNRLSDSRWLVILIIRKLRIFPALCSRSME